MELGFVFFSHYMPYFDKKIDYFIVIGLSNCGMGGPFPKPTTLASCWKSYLCCCNAEQQICFP